MKVIKQVVFDSDRDADILAWLSRQGKGKESAATREAIREKMGVSLADLYRELQEIKRQGVRVSPQRQTADSTDSEPPEAAALDQLLISG